jgi:hypothetical protein
MRSIGARSCRTAVIAVFTLALGACSSLPAVRCGNGEQPAIQESIYFGTGKPNGVVTAQEWTQFLEAIVTPRFPQGLSVSEVSGQWRGADGTTVREASHVLLLVHANDLKAEKLVAEIVAAYKTQFQQEAVLRVRSAACMSL